MKEILGNIRNGLIAIVIISLAASAFFVAAIVVAKFVVLPVLKWANL